MFDETRKVGLPVALFLYKYIFLVELTRILFGTDQNDLE
jgi:hypothetical protein